MRTLTEPLQEAQEYKKLVEALAKPKAKALA